MGNFFLENKKLACLGSVYLPREDSYLLAETVKIKPNSVVLDMGCGTGIQGISMLLQGAKKCVFADIDENALQNAAENIHALGMGNMADFVETDLFNGISGKFDCIVFNPPYVVSEKIEDTAIDGEKHGRKLLDGFLNQFAHYLEKNGECYFLQSSLNSIEETEKKLGKMKANYSIVARQKLFFEELVVFKCASGSILNKKNT